jgi:hypothetical protein
MAREVAFYIVELYLLLTTIPKMNVYLISNFGQLSDDYET